MNIVVFTDTFYPQSNGVVTHIVNVYSELANRGHKILILAPSKPGGKEARAHKNIQVKRLPSLSVPLYEEHRIAAPLIDKCVKLVSQFNADVIHVHTFAILCYLGVRTAKKLDLPLVGTYNTLMDISALYLERFLTFGLTQFNQNGLSIVEKALTKISVQLFRSCDIVVVPSKTIQRYVKKIGIRKPVAVVSNGIKSDLFPAKKKYDKKIQKFLYVGRLSLEKNVSDIIRAFALVVRENSNLTLSIVGDGPTRRECEQLVDDLDISKYVIFHGSVPYDSLGKHYRKADVFVIASLTETQGLVVVEAMSCGLPIVGVNCNALPELIDPPNNGITVDKEDPKKLANAMEHMIENPLEAIRMGKHGVQDAKKHDVSIVANELEDIYSKLIKKKKRK